MISKWTFSLKIRNLNWNFLKKCRILKWSFLLQNDRFLNREFFSTKWFFDKILFEKSFCGDKIFLKIRFWVQFILRNQILKKTSRLWNNVLTRFAPRTTTSFSLFVLVLKGMILKQAFPLKFRVWNEKLRKKESDYEANFFLQIEILKWHLFKISDCKLKIFRSGRFYNEKLFKQSYSGERIFSRNSVFEFSFYWEIRFR